MMHVSFRLYFIVCCFFSLFIVNAYPLSHQDAVNEVSSYGIQVIELGDEVRIIIPSSLMFLPNHPRLLSKATEPLNAVADYLRSLKKESVFIAAYTDDQAHPTRNLLISDQQAQAIADYLWESGIEARFQSANGFGQSFPIADNQSFLGRNKNRRVEILSRVISD